jgi:hypothetical protein
MDFVSNCKNVCWRDSTNETTNFVVFSPQANFTDLSIAAAGEVVSTFAGRECCVVGATNPFGRQSEFPRPEPLLFVSSCSSIILTRLSETSSRPATPRRTDSARNRNQHLWISNQEHWPLDHRGGPETPQAGQLVSFSFRPFRYFQSPIW